MSTTLEKIRAWFRRAEEPVVEVADGLEPAATPGAWGDVDRESSTNAQIEGAVGEPYDE